MWLATAVFHAEPTLRIARTNPCCCKQHREYSSIFFCVWPSQKDVMFPSHMITSGQPLNYGYWGVRVVTHLHHLGFSCWTTKHWQSPSASQELEFIVSMKISAYFRVSIVYPRSCCISLGHCSLKSNISVSTHSIRAPSHHQARLLAAAAAHTEDWPWATLPITGCLLLLNGISNARSGIHDDIFGFRSNTRIRPYLPLR